MRRLPMLLSLAVMMLIALPSTAGAQGADVYGVGGGSVNLGGVVKFSKFAFSGHTGPQGDFGHFRVTIEDPAFPLDVHADADCVRVFPFPLGGGGYISGPTKKVTPQPNVAGIEPGDHLIIGFNDFGEPSDLVADEFAATEGSPRRAGSLHSCFSTRSTKGTSSSSSIRLVVT